MVQARLEAGGEVARAIFGPISPSILLPAKPDINASTAFPHSTPFWRAKSIASAIPWMLTTWTIRLQALVTWPAP